MALLFPRNPFSLIKRFPLDPMDALEESLYSDLMMIDQTDRLLREKKCGKKPQRFRIKVDCREYKPDSIKAELSEDKTKLIVKAKEGEENTSEDGDYSIKEFRRSFKLPENVDVEKMTSFVDQDGNLVAEFPLKEIEKSAVVAKRKNDALLPIVTEENGSKKVKLNLNLPEEIDASKVKVVCKNRDLIIRAEDLVEKPDGVSKLFYYRRSTLPENTDFDALKCTLENNKLMIEAPYNSEPTLNQRTIPIELKQEQTKSIQAEQ